jgi:hypothetical protein
VAKSKCSAPAHTTTDPNTRAGDPFAYAGDKPRGCSLCFGGYITMTAEEDGREYDEVVPCRRCRPETR